MRGLAECLSKLFLLEPSHSSEDFTVFHLLNVSVTPLGNKIRKIEETC